MEKLKFDDVLKSYHDYAGDVKECCWLVNESMIKELYTLKFPNTKNLEYIIRYQSEYIQHGMDTSNGAHLGTLLGLPVYRCDNVDSLLLCRENDKWED